MDLSPISPAPMTDAPDDLKDARLRKLKFRASRRGFREADLIIGLFAQAEVDAMSAEDLDAFEILLEQPDQFLYGWIIGREPPPPAFDGPVLRRLQAFVPKTHRHMAAGG